MQASIDKIISEIIHNNINPWFLNWEKSNSNCFQNQLKIFLDQVFLNLSVGLKQMDKSQLITRITQRLKSHLIHYRNIEGSAVNVYDVPIEKYLKLSWKLLSFALPKRDSESRVLFAFLNEIVAGTILPVIVRKISNPHFLNTLIMHALSVSLDTDQFKKNRDLALNDIIDQGQGLLEFIQFLKEQNAYPMLQFYYAVDSYKKIFDFMGTVKDSGKHALEIFNLFFSMDSNPNNRIYLHGHGKLLKKTLVNIQIDPNSQVFDLLLNCILGLLEDRYLPVFRKSQYYKDYLKESSSNVPGLRRKMGCRNLEIKDQTRCSYLLQKLDLQIKGKLDRLSLQDDLRFLELRMEQETNEDILLELEKEKKEILDRILSLELKPSLDDLDSTSCDSQKDVELKESLEHIHEKNNCAKSISKAFSCVGQSLRRSLNISKPQGRCKSQDPYTKNIHEDKGSILFDQDSKSFEKSLSEERIVSAVISHQIAKAASTFEFEGENELRIVKYAGNQTGKSHKVKKEEMNFVLDCTCEVIEEVFHLSAPTNWLRSQGLYLVKALLRSAYGSVISEMIQNTVADLLKEDTICFYLDTIREYVWPNDDYTEPTVEEKAFIKSKAWDLLMEQGAPRETKLGIGIYRIQSIVGKYSTIIGLTRLFNMLQHEELNRLLAFSFLEVLIDLSCIQ